jgi:hypothetical protein
MQHQPHVALFLAQDKRRAEIARAARERRVAKPRSSARQSIGRRVIAIGQRIAAEPSLELARSRCGSSQLTDPRRSSDDHRRP